MENEENSKPASFSHQEKVLQVIKYITYTIHFYVLLEFAYWFVVAILSWIVNTPHQIHLSEVHRFIVICSVASLFSLISVYRYIKKANNVMIERIFFVASLCTFLGLIILLLLYVTSI